MVKAFALIYGMAACILFGATAIYAVGFIANLIVPKSIDSGAAGPWPQALLIDIGLFAVFALQHSVMARQGFKRWWTRFIPGCIERATYVLAASLLLALLLWLWRPMPYPIWEIANAPARLVLWGLFWAGWSVVLIAAFLSNHLELIGLQQIMDALRDRQGSAPQLTTSGLYRIVRHPIYAGSIVAFWATPSMTAGHLLLAAMATAYTVLGACFEERDLLNTFGDSYRRYQRDVRMLVPLPK
ncbi:MAG: isoprenylcysteine carboxylmethyltransferase family protein [Alphaproteobacteria bacterium]|nr:MAG: isoprenylcysteine carboxylmethyltransferase family protein [Alphaproteobacteria bacterium]